MWDTEPLLRESKEVERKILRPMCSLPCDRGKASVVLWNHRFNMMATADSELIMWLPDEHVGMNAL